MRWPLGRRWPWITIAVIVMLVIGIDLALPSWIKSTLNRKLDHMGAYHGRVRDVSLHLWRGAYSIDELLIERRGGKSSIPLLHAPRMDLAVSWNALLRGAIVSTVDFQSPEINFIDAPATENGKGIDWRVQLERLMPIRLDEVRVHDGTVRFRALSTKPPVDLKATQFNATVANLSNVRDAGKRAATLDAHAQVLGSAPLAINAAFDPLGTLKDFKLNFKITDIDLTRANDFLRAYVKLDVASGSGDFVMQLEASDGKLSGYAKPLLQHVKVFSWKKDVEQEHDNPLRLAWELLAGGIENVFKNQKNDQFATRIEIHGEIGDSKTSTWQAIIAVLHNAFVGAFRPQFENLSKRPTEDQGD
ncbi:MAG: DUF748 domain-containing protein [Dokdonella sp.]